MARRSTGGLPVVQRATLYSYKAYPDKLRRIRYLDAEQNKRLIFLSNNSSLTALTIAELFRCRWQFELFFKWINSTFESKHFTEQPRMPSRPKSG
jgi:hypothetical protein